VTPSAIVLWAEIRYGKRNDFGENFDVSTHLVSLRRNQFDQLARLREIFTSQLAMAEVTPVFRNVDVSSVYSEPAYRFNLGPGSVCSEPAYRPPEDNSRCNGCRQSFLADRSPSQNSLPSLNGIVAIASMEQVCILKGFISTFSAF
jgi:kinesin family member 26